MILWPCSEFGFRILVVFGVFIVKSQAPQCLESGPRGLGLKQGFLDCNGVDVDVRILDRTAGDVNPAPPNYTLLLLGVLVCEAMQDLYGQQQYHPVFQRLVEQSGVVRRKRGSSDTRHGRVQLYFWDQHTWCRILSLWSPHCQLHLQI